MFTGIIESVGRIRALRPSGDDLVLELDAAGLDLADVKPGDSIAVNGVCLTVTDIGGRGFCADVSRETLRLSRLGALAPGDAVNLEKAMAMGGRLGGHLVSGHVDGVGQVLERRNDGRAIRFRIRPPAAISRYIAARGSICVDGASLTVNDLDGEDFWLNVVPHTARETIMAGYRPGTKVHLEVDVIARYLERLLQQGGASEHSGGLSLDVLRQHGFMG